MSPTRSSLRRLPDAWINPYTGEEMALTLPEVIALAEQTGAICLTAAMRYWLGTFSEDKLAAVLGNNQYHTGLPCKGDALPKESTAEQETEGPGRPEAPLPRTDTA